MTKTTRRAFLSSVVALVICLTMLIGTTFAWFTDTASTAVNTIQSGTLNVTLKDADGNPLEGETLSWKKAEGAPDDEQVLWEPGCTYSLEDIVVKNDGNLALKYKVVITGIDGSAKLNDAIEWRIGIVGEDNSVQDLDGEFHLAPNEANTLVISGHMKEEAGDEYQGLAIKNIAITVYATQDTVEFDSTTNEYDEDAAYLIDTSGSNGTSYNATSVTLNPYVIKHEYDGSQSDGKAIYLNNGAELTLDNVDFTTTVNNDSGKRNIGIFLYNGSKLTINGGDYVMDGQWNAFIWAQGGKNGERCTVTINGGNFTLNGTSYSSIITAYSGYGYCGSDVYITGGFFDLSAANPNLTLQWKSDCTMTVTGGTFVNYNPADHRTVPDGYTVEAEAQSNGKTHYTVIKTTN